MHEAPRFHIEPDGREDHTGEGGETLRTAWGYVEADDQPLAVYFARWYPDEPDREGRLLVSIGEWGEGADPATRRAVGLAYRAAGEAGMRVVDANTLPWAGEDFLGQMLTPLEALAGGLGQRALRMGEAIAAGDPALAGASSR